jgi:hypothetical protein
MSSLARLTAEGKPSIVMIQEVNNGTEPSRFNLINEFFKKTWHQRHWTEQSVKDVAEMLLLAQKIGTLSLTLRNPSDRELMQERSWTTLKTLLTRERAKKLRTRRIHTLDTVRILRGIKGVPMQ